MLKGWYLRFVSMSEYTVIAADQFPDDEMIIITLISENASPEISLTLNTSAGNVACQYNIGC